MTLSKSESFNKGKKKRRKEEKRQLDVHVLALLGDFNGIVFMLIYIMFPIAMFHWLVDLSTKFQTERLHFGGEHVRPTQFSHAC